MKIERVLGPCRGLRRIRIARVELSTPRRNLFVSLSLTSKLVGAWTSFREFRITLLGVQLHYRETAWRQPETS